MYELADFGSFMIPGRIASLSGQPKKRVQRNPKLSFEIDPNGHYAVENTYVEYFIPTQTKHTVIFVHGGGLCGNTWSTTPDGRPGFLQLFLQQQYAVYVVDTVERGRAGWCSVPEIWPEAAESRTAETTWSAFRIGDEEGFGDRQAFQKQQFPVDAFDSFVCYQVPRWDVHTDASVAGLNQLLQKMDEPCVIIGHSQGCDLVMRTFEQRPDKVSHIILMEPSACYDLNDINNQTTPLLIVWGDYLIGNAFWEKLYVASVQYQIELLALGLQAQVLQLPAKSITGNSHALMMDMNNADIAEKLMAWVDTGNI